MEMLITGKFIKRDEGRRISHPEMSLAYCVKLFLGNSRQGMGSENQVGSFPLVRN